LVKVQHRPLDGVSAAPEAISSSYLKTNHLLWIYNSF